VGIASLPAGLRLDAATQVCSTWRDTLISELLAALSSFTYVDPVASRARITPRALRANNTERACAATARPRAGAEAPPAQPKLNRQIKRLPAAPAIERANLRDRVTRPELHRLVMGVVMRVVMVVVMVPVVRSRIARTRKQTQRNRDSDELGHDSIQPA